MAEFLVALGIGLIYVGVYWYVKDKERRNDEK